MKFIKNIQALVLYICTFKFRFLFVIKALFAGNGNVLMCEGVVRNGSVTLSGNDNEIRISPNARLNNVRFEIRGNNNIIEIGKECAFSEGGRIRLEGNDNKLVIGYKSNLINVFFSIGHNGRTVRIKNNCLISSDVVFRTWDNHSIVSVDNPKKRIVGDGDIMVENHVWIGNGVLVMKNVTIGQDSIIGAKSIVTKDVSANSLVVGCPIRVVKEGVTWNEKWYE